MQGFLTLILFIVEGVSGSEDFTIDDETSNTPPQSNIGNKKIAGSSAQQQFYNKVKFNFYE